VTRQELKDLLDEIRNMGREEDASVEWKRKWHNLAVQESRKEFIKDVTAMANAFTEKEARHIIFGLKNGQLFDAPLPCDEAELQVHLKAITPKPNVAFQNFKVEDKQLSVMEVRAPFERPYVANVEDNFYVWVRTGSSNGTASRRMLDRFYREQRRVSELEFGWAVFETDEEGEITRAQEGEALGLHVEKTSAAVMRQAFERRVAFLCPPVERLRERKESYHEQELEEYRVAREAAVAQAEEILSRWEKPEKFRRWYSAEEWKERAKKCRVWIANRGTKGARGVRCKIALPGWLRVGPDAKPNKQWLWPEEEYEWPVELPQPPEPEEPSKKKARSRKGGLDWGSMNVADPRKMLQGMRIDTAREIARLARPELPQLRDSELFQHPMTGIEPITPEALSVGRRESFELKKERVEIEVEAIRHKDHWLSDAFYIMALPDAPLGSSEIRVEFITEDEEEFRVARLPVQISEDPS
jgi:hypothetical protein